MLQKVGGVGGRWSPAMLLCVYPPFLGVLVGCGVIGKGGRLLEQSKPSGIPCMMEMVFCLHLLVHPRQLRAQGGGWVRAEQRCLEPTKRLPTSACVARVPARHPSQYRKNQAGEHLWGGGKVGDGEEDAILPGATCNIRYTFLREVFTHD